MAGDAGDPAQGQAAAEPVQGQDVARGLAGQMQPEMMALYKENKVNPFASCLPLLLQIPIFIALNSVLRYHVHPTGDKAFLFINNIFVEMKDLPPRAGAVHRRHLPGLDARLDVAVLVRFPTRSSSTCSPAWRSCSCSSSRTSPSASGDLLDHHQPVDDRAAGLDQAHHGPPLPTSADQSQGDRQVGPRQVPRARVASRRRSGSRNPPKDSRRARSRVAAASAGGKQQ